MKQPSFTINVAKQDGNTAQVHIEPLEKGFGHTLGNALRRIMLTDLPGAAASHVQIDGVNHQFTTLGGLQQNIVDFILNLKQVRFQLEGDQPIAVKLNKKGQGEITAADFDCPTGVKVTNPEHVLCSLTSDKSKFNAVITVAPGTGYAPAEEHATKEIGVIPLDASFSPVIHAAYTVEATRVGRRTDLDKIIFDIETDGSITAQAAIEESARILLAYLNQIIDPVIAEVPAAVISTNPLLDQSVEELELPTRITNALKKGGFKKLSDFSVATKSDLMKVKNLGEKTVNEIIDSLKNKGIKVE